MSRLQNHQQKQFATKIVALVIIFILIIYFIFTLGFKLLLGMSAFIAGLNTKNNSGSPQLTKSPDTFGTVTIDTIPSATSSSTITVTGSVINFDVITFYINGDKVKEEDLNNSDTFSTEIGDLEIGQNEVFVEAKTRNSLTKKQSDLYTVLYKAEKPKLEISEPGDKSKTNKQDITIKGITDKETYIKVNEMPVVVDAQGKFETGIRLKDGDNQINVTAQDIAGNIEAKTISVSYQKDD